MEIEQHNIMVLSADTGIESDGRAQYHACNIVSHSALQCIVKLIIIVTLLSLPSCQFAAGAIYNII